jgi:glucosamine-6-phosphate deaminase
MDKALIGDSSKVEEYFLSESGNLKVSSEHERIKVVSVNNYVVLGQLTALRFLEWVSEHPEGMAALPTGKTPEYFIKWMHYYLANWDSETKDGMLAKVGMGSIARPKMDGLRFVQLDEFFPIRPDHERSFAYFVRKFYIQGFGLDPHRALLIDTFGLPKGLEEAAFPHKNLQDVFVDGNIDLGLRIRQAMNGKEILQQKVINRFEEFCEGYEEKIRGFGGIGFFLGGIGPDGHIAFNIRGTSHHSTTRLDKLNYESQAAASTDLGGIDAVRKKAVITIGLGTITYNSTAVAIIMAAGETKAQIVANALEQVPSIQNPASALQKLPNARFFLTLGSSSKLKFRRLASLQALANPKPQDLERLIIDGALSEHAPGLTVTAQQATSAEVREWRLASKIGRQAVPDLLQTVTNSIKAKFQRGREMPADKVWLHTAPHHDDIELAYFPVIHHLVRSEKHESHFCYLTSGFTAVTNQYLMTRLHQLADLLLTNGLGRKIPLSDLRIPATGQQEIHGYLKAIAQRNQEAEEYYTACRLSRFVFEQRTNITQDEALVYVRNQIAILEKLESGQVDPESIQLMKGWIREWEAELVWAHFGHGRDHVHHLRLKFYTGAIFPEDPDYQRDVVPMLELLEKVKPNIVTVAMDPEGSGPDTHFKVLIAVARALEAYVKIHGDTGIRVFGYRNIWSRYHISEVDTIVPISLNSFAVLDSMFKACFISQRTASFPSPELNGTFSELAQKIWVEQHNDLNKLLGRNFFYDSPNPMLRRAYGAIYLKDMSYAEFNAEMQPMYQFLDSKKNLSKRQIL